MAIMVAKSMPCLVITGLSGSARGPAELACCRTGSGIIRSAALKAGSLIGPTGASNIGAVLLGRSTNAVPSPSSYFGPGLTGRMEEAGACSNPMGESDLPRSAARAGFSFTALSTSALNLS